MTLTVSRKDMKWLIMRALAWMFMFALIASMLRDATADEQKDKEWEFVRTVLLTTEDGNDPAPIVRWTKTPLYYVHADDAEFRHLVRETLDHVNAAIGDNHPKARLTVTPDDDWDASVAKAPFERLEKFYQNIGCDDGHWTPANGVNCVVYDIRNHQIELAFILVADDLSDSHLRGVLLEEIYQSFGISNDHGVFPESINYEDEQAVTVRPDLAPIDRKILHFLYGHLEPGDDEATVRAQFDKHWHTIAVD